MSTEDRWRAVAQSSPDRANAWALPGYDGHHRMGELLHEAEQERLAGLAGRAGRSGFWGRHRVGIPALVSGALTAMTNVKRHLAIPSHGSDAR
jgi:hypothetical protein